MRDICVYTHLYSADNTILNFFRNKSSKSIKFNINYILFYIHLFPIVSKYTSYFSFFSFSSLIQCATIKTNDFFFVFEIHEKFIKYFYLNVLVTSTSVNC